MLLEKWTPSRPAGDQGGEAGSGDWLWGLALEAEMKWQWVQYLRLEPPLLSAQNPNQLSFQPTNSFMSRNLV